MWLHRPTLLPSYRELNAHTGDGEIRFVHCSNVSFLANNIMLYATTTGRNWVRNMQNCWFISDNFVWIYLKIKILVQRMRTKSKRMQVYTDSLGGYISEQSPVPFSDCLENMNKSPFTQIGHQRKTKEITAPTSTLVNQPVTWAHIQDWGWGVI